MIRSSNPKFVILLGFRKPLVVLGISFKKIGDMIETGLFKLK